MKLLLVNPNFAGVVIIPSFGLGYIGTYVRDRSDWEVEIIESINKNWTEDNALQRARDAAIVGLVCYTESRFFAYSFARKVKMINPDCQIILGGHHVTTLDTLILQYCMAIDIVVRNESEETVLELVQGKPKEQIAGITWRKDAQVVRNPDRPLQKKIEHLTYDYELAFPTVRTWKDNEVSADLQKLNHIPIISSRGCPFVCNFCGAHSHWFGSYRPQDPVVLVSEMKRLIDTYNIGYFRFYDALFSGSQKNILQFCDLLEAEQLNIHFRIDIRVGTSPYLLERLRRVGCDVLGFGVETGSDKILQRINKGITHDEVKETIGICRQLGFYLIGFFMVSHPDETMDDVKKTFDLFENLHNYNLQIFKIHPNTTFYEELKRNGEIKDESWFNPLVGFNTPFGNELYYCKELFPSASFNLNQAQLIVQYSGNIFMASHAQTLLKKDMTIPEKIRIATPRSRPRIALVNPGQNKQWATIHPPMNLASLASMLEADGNEVMILDELVGQNIEGSLQLWKPDVVGITATTPLVPDAYRIARISREMGFHTVMGGVHVSILPHEALAHADQVVIGEGENALQEIAKGRKDKIVKCDSIKDLNALPMPAWHLLDMEFYCATRRRLPDTHLRFLPYESKIASIMAARGCPFSCVFCNNSWQKYPMRFLNAQRVIQEIECLITKYKADAIYFAEDDFLANKKRAREIVTMILDKNFQIKFSCQVRAKAADPELFALMKKAGCSQIQFGLETGSQRILNYLKKNTTTIEENERAIEICRDAGIEPFATFMIGTPTETEHDIEMTRNFIRKTKLRETGILMLYPYPGTEIWQWCEKEGLIPDHIDWNIYSGNRISIQANKTIPTHRLLQLFDEMLHEFRYHTVP